MNAYEAAAEMFLGDAIELARRGEYEQADVLVEMHAWCMLMARPTQTDVPQE